ncbi:diacylglycerol kinase (ATP) [Rhizobium borbori]|uniref:Diacylglycerol kinase n=1 Tax=Allorhizobium borbori TaxID=485907 RepID=A0A7W6K1K5_9HYPH|nr:diacylglycerol kinase (ATP) [Allorhizobium borbori]
MTKETGVRHVFAALRYSIQGISRLMREQAFRHELMAFAGGLVILAVAGADVSKFVGFVVLMLALFAAEALNTAIEELVDRVSPEISQVGKHAKDLGSFACFCLILANALYLVWAVLIG